VGSAAGRTVTMFLVSARRKEIGQQTTQNKPADRRVKNALTRLNLRATGQESGARLPHALRSFYHLSRHCHPANFTVLAVVGNTRRVHPCLVSMPRGMRVTACQRAVLLHRHQLRFLDRLVVQVAHVRIAVGGAPEHVAELRGHNPIKRFVLN